jgi:hypothetical protein
LTRSGRSLLRRAPVLLAACCLAVAPGVPALAQSGPAPDPGRVGPGGPSPDPPPNSDPSAPVPDSGSPTPAAGPSSSATVQPPPPPPPNVAVQSTTTPTRTPVQTGPKRRQTEKAERRDAPPEWTPKEVTRYAVPSIQRIEGSSSVTLMLGGLALFALVLCDTVFLTLSTRAIRR